MRPRRTLHDDTVTIVKVTPGAPVGGKPTEARTLHEWVGVNVQQEKTSTDVDRRLQTTTIYRVAGPIPPVQPAEGDRIEWQAREYLVVGEPDTRRGRARINHTSLRMRRSTG